MVSNWRLILKNKDNHKAKDRIINAATKLFSRKGFSATSVNEIAKEAKVTKALIYYYFKSKKDVLDCLVSSLSKNTNSATIDFIHASIDGLIKEGRLDVLPDRPVLPMTKQLTVFRAKPANIIARYLIMSGKQKNNPIFLWNRLAADTTGDVALNEFWTRRF